MMNAGARKNAIPTATKRPTVKIIRAYERKFEACGFV